jgi:hypothetical protein
MKRTIRIGSVVLAASAAIAASALAAQTPGVKTDAASNVKDTTAVLNATINPQGSNTSYQFQYGLTNVYGAITPLKSAGRGTKSIAVKSPISGLVPGTPYHYRIVATNGSGVSTGLDHTVTTTGHPPAVPTTGTATSIGKTSATVNGTIQPNGEATTWAFQYGLTTSYGLQASGGVLAASTTPSAVTSQLTGIAPGTLFHFRLVAFHGVTPSYGADQTFFTLPSPAPTPKVKRFTSPLTDKKKPYVFTTHGSLTHPAAIPASVACFGDVQVRYFLGHKQIAGDVAALSATCSYTSTATFNRFQGSKKFRKHLKTEKLTVVVHWGGNGYLGAANSGTKTVTLG